MDLKIQADPLNLVQDSSSFCKMGILINQKSIKRIITVDLEVQNIISGNENIGKEIKNGHI